MKKILIVEALGEKGHKNINLFFVEKLKKYCENSGRYEIDCAMPKGYLPQERVSPKILLPAQLYEKRGKLGTRINYLKVLRYFLFHLPDKQYDICWFMSYETISFYIASVLWGRKFRNFSKVYLLEHHNVDETGRSKIKKWFSKHIGKHYIRVTYADFISEYVKRELKKECRTIKLNLPDYSGTKDVVTDRTEFFGEDTVNILVPSNNYLEPECYRMILEMEESGFLKEKGIHIYLKNPMPAVYKNMQEECLRISSVFLTREEYVKLFRCADYILLPYSENKYQYRASAVFLEAVYFEKNVIYSPILFLKEMEEKYGRFGQCFRGFHELYHIFNSLYKNPELDEGMKTIREAYAENEVIKSVATLL